MTSENTYAGAIAPHAEGWHRGYDYGGEIVEVGTNIFKSEELVDKIYALYLMLMAKHGWAGVGIAKIDDIGEAYHSGFYLPCIQRSVLAGQVDILNDTIADYAGLILEHGEQTYFSSVRKAPLVRGMVCPVKGASFTATIFWRSKNLARRDRRFGRGDDVLSMYSTPFVIQPNGEAWGAFQGATHFTRHIDGRNAKLLKLIVLDAVATLNAWEDRRYLWNVETREPIMGVPTVPTPLMLGVSPEHVKSLFYARDLPLTPLGRKRPILHWVSAHIRRIKEGIEIDISKHLRGITRFRMGELDFTITSPVKGKAK